MSTEQEFRRKKLIALKKKLGRGSVALLARQLGIDSTYISRMIADPATKQSRPISGDMVIAISKLYPDWLGEDYQLRPVFYQPNIERKSLQVSESKTSLTPDEIALVNYYRNADEKTRAYLQHISGLFPKETSAKEKIGETFPSRIKIKPAMLADEVEN